MKKILKITAVFLFVTTLISCSSDDNSESEVAPNAPTNLTGVLMSGQVRLNWTDNSNNEAGFKIERKLINGTYSQLNSVVPNVLTFDDNTITTGQTYLYRVCSYNAVGNSTSFSNEVTITVPSPVSLPTLVTNSVTSITSISGVSGGNISSDGGATITERGVVWSTSQNPTIALSTKTSDGTGSGTFTSNISSLAANTTYYVKAYATNSVGTSYGN